MGILDTLRALVGSDGAEVALDGTEAPGEARAAVADLIGRITTSIRPALRDGCTDDALDAVLDVGRLDACVTALEHALGPPAKPFGRRAVMSGDVAAMVDSRGGIDTDQCLFLRRYSDGRVAFAALWPWRDGRSVTLKVGIYDLDVTPPPSA